MKHLRTLEPVEAIDGTTPRRTSRRAVWVAAAVTAVAVPLLIVDNLPADAGDDAVTTTIAAPTSEPRTPHAERDETGPLKGVSVVTTSSTSTTQPIIVTTTTTLAVPAGA